MDLAFVVAVAALLGVHGAYYGAMADACLKIGQGLAGVIDGTRGLQDAITPPSSTKARLGNWVISLAVGAASLYILDLGALGAFVVTRFVIALAVGAYLQSDPPKDHFCKKIYGSISTREADYAASGDQIRFEAMRQLREDFERSVFFFG